MVVVENSLKFATMELIIGFFCILFALGISIATAVLASRKGRNSGNGFFLFIFWGIVGLIVSACSKHLDKEKGERDTLVNVLWTIVLI
jgi:FtsH-binding integral membrane protein